MRGNRKKQKFGCKYFVVLLELFFCMMAACSQKKEEAVLPTQAADVTDASILTLTITPTPTPTLTPTATETPVPTPTAMPLPTQDSVPAGIPSPASQPTIEPTQAVTVASVLTPTITLTPTTTETPVPTPTVTLIPTVALTDAPTLTVVPTQASVQTGIPSPASQPAIEPTQAVTVGPVLTLTITPTPTAAATDIPNQEAALTPFPTVIAVEKNSFVVVLDAGHQAKGNSEKEPNGPGSDVMKAKVSAGTRGTYTKIAEYELNLAVTLLLRDELEQRGYTVILVRETNEVDISNAERAKMANEAGADVFLRIHADGSDNPKAEGVLTICQTKDNPYNGAWYEESKRFSEILLNQVVAATGAKKRYVWETDTMTGINWAQVPSAILEMGFMTNEKEDWLLATEEYRKKIVKGAADAIDAFLTGE